MSPRPASPTTRLLAGLAVTLAAITVYSWYSLRQIDGLRKLQTSTVDRNRKDSLQLLRIQNDLNSLGLALRDMLDGEDPYPPEAWQGQFDRIRADLEDAMGIQAQLAPVAGDPQQREYLGKSLAQFWTSSGEAFTLSRRGEVARARALGRNTLQAQQAALSTTVARLLVQNNETEEQAASQIQAMYTGVERDMYVFLAIVLTAIVATSLYVIRSNRDVFIRLETLSAQRSELARKLITVQEEVLHSIARELHDEFGQVLTAMGALLSRSERHLPENSPVRAELHEVRDIAQQTLEKTRTLSHILHPPVLDDAGLERAIDSYVSVFQRQYGITLHYSKNGASPAIPGRIAIHVYRVLQEALNNVARHSHAREAWVRLQLASDSLALEVEDHGVGMPLRNGGVGIGIIGMRERAELIHAKMEIMRSSSGGTLVRLDAPISDEITEPNEISYAG